MKQKGHETTNGKKTSNLNAAHHISREVADDIVRYKNDDGRIVQTANLDIETDAAIVFEHVDTFINALLDQEEFNGKIEGKTILLAREAFDNLKRKTMRRLNYVGQYLGHIEIVETCYNQPGIPPEMPVDVILRPVEVQS